MKILKSWEKIARKINVRIRLLIAFTLIKAAITGTMGIYATYVMKDHLMESA